MFDRENIITPLRYQKKMSDLDYNYICVTLDERL